MGAMQRHTKSRCLRQTERNRHARGLRPGLQLHFWHREEFGAGRKGREGERGAVTSTQREEGGAGQGGGESTKGNTRM